MDDDAAILMACLNHRGRWTALRHVISTWDMINVDVPARVVIERAAGLLIGSGLAEVRDASDLRLSDRGVELYRSVNLKGLGMREIPAALGPALAAALKEPIRVDLSDADYAVALRRYRGR